MEYNSKYYGHEIDHKLDLMDIDETISQYVKEMICKYKQKTNIEINDSFITVYHEKNDYWEDILPEFISDENYVFETFYGSMFDQDYSYCVVKDANTENKIGFVYIRHDYDEYTGEGNYVTATREKVVNSSDPLKSGYDNYSYIIKNSDVTFKLGHFANPETYTVPFGTTWREFIGDGKVIETDVKLVVDGDRIILEETDPYTNIENPYIEIPADTLIIPGSFTYSTTGA